jgi:hypothetical protein
MRVRNHLEYLALLSNVPRDEAKRRAIEAALSIAVSVVITALLIPLAARLYSGAILRMGGQVKLKEAWRQAA